MGESGEGRGRQGKRGGRDVRERCEVRDGVCEGDEIVNILRSFLMISW